MSVLESDEEITQHTIENRHSDDEPKLESAGTSIENIHYDVYETLLVDYLMWCSLHF